MCRGTGDAAEFGDTDEIVEAAQLHGDADFAHPQASRSTEIDDLLMPPRHEHDRKSVFA
jgi:hypothetical protein